MALHSLTLASSQKPETSALQTTELETSQFPFGIGNDLPSVIGLSAVLGTTVAISVFLVLKLFRPFSNRRTSTYRSPTARSYRAANRAYSTRPTAATIKRQVAPYVQASDSKKRQSLRLYENRIDHLINELSSLAGECRRNTQNEIRSKLYYSNYSFAGFNRKEKIERFERECIQPIFSRNWDKFKYKVRNIGEQFRVTEEQLNEELESVLWELVRNCRDLKILPPTHRSFASKIRGRKLLEGNLTLELRDAGTMVVASGLLIQATSNAAVHGSATAAGHAGVAGHSVGHGITLSSTHAIGHSGATIAGHTAAGHAAAHGGTAVAGHAAGHAVGAVFPLIYVGFAAFYGLKAWKFFFDDSEQKSELLSHVNRYIESQYRSALEGSGGNPGLLDQLRTASSQFSRQREATFDQTSNNLLEELLSMSVS